MLADDRRQLATSSPWPLDCHVISPQSHNVLTNAAYCLPNLLGSSSPCAAWLDINRKNLEISMIDVEMENRDAARQANPDVKVRNI